MINKRDNKNSSGIEAERKQVAATLKGAQPKPNSSAAPTAADAIAQSIPIRH